MGVGHDLAVATPELIGVLAWWSVVLIAPVLFIRRWRRRGLIGRRPRSLIADGGLDPNAADRDAGRLSSGTLVPLCRYVDFRRRLELAVSELECQLSALPADRWRVEPYPLTGDRRNTLLVLGETGVFVISATYAPGHWDDVVTVSRLARKIQLLLPGYAGQVHGAICHPFSSVQPRLWHRADECGAWVEAWLVGGDSLIEWLVHFDDEHGLGRGDLRRFDELCKPNWLRPAVPTARTWPPRLDGARSFSQE